MTADAHPDAPNEAVEAAAIAWWNSESRFAPWGPEVTQDAIREKMRAVIQALVDGDHVVSGQRFGEVVHELELARAERDSAVAALAELRERFNENQRARFMRYAEEHAKVLALELRLSTATELIDLFHSEFDPHVWQCWTPDTCNEAIADGEPHGHCPGCEMQSWLAVFDNPVTSEAHEPQRAVIRAWADAERARQTSGTEEQ